MNETFEKVLGYMVAHESGNADEAFFDRAAWRELIVMLRAAHEREMAAVVAERDAEIRRRALLERALKPVMEIKFSSDDIRNLDEIEYRLLLQGVIAKAQRIILEAWDDKNYFWKGENND